MSDCKVVKKSKQDVDTSGTAVAFESDGIYDDLLEYQHSKDYERLVARLEASEKANSELLAEIVDLKSQLEIVLTEKQRLEDNITLVYNTALKELARKEKELAGIKSGH